MKTLKTRAMGQFYQRPIEAVLDRLNQNINQAQPSHLRHLAIIRDTAQSGKTCHYQYFTQENFQKLVDQGKTSWDSVNIGRSGKKKTSKAAKESKDITEYDEYGFPILPDSLFLKDGCATLSESVSASKSPDIVYTAFDPVLRQKEDGTYGTFSVKSLRLLPR